MRKIGGNRLREREDDLNKQEAFTFCVASLSSMTVSILEVVMIITEMGQW